MPRLICGVQRSSRRFAARPRARRNGIFQHLLVKLDADLADMARLFLAEQIARAANIHIVARELETCAELIERLDHLEPLLRRASKAARVGA